MVVIDFRTASFVGDGINKIERPASRRLNTRLADCKGYYVCSLEGNIVRHRLRKKGGKGAQRGSAKRDEKKEVGSD